MIFQACHVYAVKRAVDIGHKEGPAGNEEIAFKRIWQGHRIAAIHNKALSARYVAHNPSA